MIVLPNVYYFWCRDQNVLLTMSFCMQNCALNVGLLSNLSFRGVRWNLNDPGVV